MADTYYAVTRIKGEDGEYAERGDKVTKSAYGDDWDMLVSSGSVVTKDQFDALFPERADEGQVSYDEEGLVAQLNKNAQTISDPEKGTDDHKNDGKPADGAPPAAPTVQTPTGTGNAPSA